MKVRKTVTFECTVEVSDESTEAVAGVSADITIEQALECLDGLERDECQIQGVHGIHIEHTEFVL